MRLIYKFYKIPQKLIKASAIAKLINSLKGVFAKNEKGVKAYGEKKALLIATNLTPIL